MFLRTREGLGADLEARVEGSFIVTDDGQKFTSLSAAAKRAAFPLYGYERSFNGWDVWEARRPGEASWTRMGVLRSRARRGG